MTFAVTSKKPRYFKYLAVRAGKSYIETKVEKRVGCA